MVTSAGVKSAVGLSARPRRRTFLARRLAPHLDHASRRAGVNREPAAGLSCPAWLHVFRLAATEHKGPDKGPILVVISGPDKGLLNGSDGPWQSHAPIGAPLRRRTDSRSRFSRLSSMMVEADVGEDLLANCSMLTDTSPITLRV